MKSKLLRYYFQIFGWLAKRYIKKYSPMVIGITGSIGKTSCRMIVSQILEKHSPNKKVYTSSKNYNGELGMSFSILGISDYVPNVFGIIKVIFQAIGISFFGKKQYDIIVLEYGIDRKGEMEFLLSIIPPDIGIVTKIDAVHSMQFENKEIIAKEKYQLLTHSKLFTFLNTDDVFSSTYEKRIKVQKYYYSTMFEQSSSLDIGWKNEKCITKNTIPYTEFDVFFGQNSIHITTNLLGKENFSYISLGYFIIHKLFGITLITDEIHLALQPSRFQVFQGINESILIDSSYNAAPASMKTIIENVLTFKKELYPEYELVFCLGEMRELGKYSQQEHEKLAKFVSPLTSSIFVVGESMEKYFIPACVGAKHFKNSRLLGTYLQDFLKGKNKKYLLLFKGSQNTIFMEEAIKMILQNTTEASNLCRQDEYWMKKKEKFYNFL